MAEERTSRITIKNKRGFTMVELIVVIAIIGFLIMIVSPRLIWTEPPVRVMQRALIEAIEISRKGLPLRFSIAKGGGPITPEIFMNVEEEKIAGEWLPVEMRNAPTGIWRGTPEMIYFFPDGTCSPARLEFGTPPESEKFLLTVTGYLVQEK